ncbi:MAG TPA: DUF3168 domain-containing protein [Asticcacaulis sp.]|nr:DUF3168 domain-containing protein [Asticcacaulis sp.]
MKDPSVPLQKAVYDTLRAALDISIGVYDRVPADSTGTIPIATFPYVHIGEDQIASDADQCHDASTAYATVHVWSRAVGKVEAKTIMAQVCLALDVKLTVTGFEIIGHAVDDGPRHLDGGDGLTSHSVATFRYRLGPTT